MHKLSLIALLVLPFFGVAQETLSKNHIRLSFNAWSPLISNKKMPESNKYKNGNIVNQDDYFDWGFRLSYDRMISRRFAIGLEAGADFFSIYKDKITYYSVDSVRTIRYENRDIVSWAIMPKITLYGRREFWKFGTFVHQLGFGVSLADPIYKNYHAQTFTSRYPTLNLPGPVFADPAKKLYYNGSENLGWIVMYGLQMQKQLTSRLAFNYGFRLTYNYMPWPATYFTLPLGPYYDNGGNNAFSYFLNERAKWMFARFDAGLTLAL